MADSEWLAVLGRFGLVRGSFIPPQDLRELRLVSRYRRKLTSTLAAEKNRLHKVLDDAGITLGAIVADSDGVSARRMIAGLIDGQTPAELAALGLGKLRDKQEDLALALDGHLSPPGTASCCNNSMPISASWNNAWAIATAHPVRRHAALSVGLSLVTDHPGHRPDRGRVDPHRDRR